MNWYLADAVSILVFSFNGITSVPVIFTELRDGTKERMNKIINRSILLSTIVYLLLGVFGYMSYMDNMPSLIIERDPLMGGTDWLMMAAKLVLTISLLGAILLANNPLRLQVVKIL